MKKKLLLTVLVVGSFGGVLATNAFAASPETVEVTQAEAEGPQPDASIPAAVTRLARAYSPMVQEYVRQATRNLRHASPFSEDPVESGAPAEEALD